MKGCSGQGDLAVSNDNSFILLQMVAFKQLREAVCQNGHMCDLPHSSRCAEVQAYFPSKYWMWEKLGVHGMQTSECTMKSHDSMIQKKVRQTKVLKQLQVNTVWSALCQHAKAMLCLLYVMEMPWKILAVKMLTIFSFMSQKQTESSEFPTYETVCLNFILKYFKNYSFSIDKIMSSCLFSYNTPVFSLEAWVIFQNSAC